MNSASPPPSPRSGPPLLKRVDQAAVAGLVLLALVSMGAYWFAQGGATGRLIELDRAPRHTAQFQLNVNVADWPEFSVLPGVGETLARRIVESRKSEGPFTSLDDLQRVRGIGPKTLDGMRPYLLPLAGTENVAER